MNDEDDSEKGGSITKKQLMEINYQMEKKICKIIESNDHKATGFFCEIPYPDQFHLLKVLVTNNHVINREDIKINKKVKLIINNGKKEILLLIDEKRKVYTNEDLDVTIIEIYKEEKDNYNNVVNINDFIEYFRLDDYFNDNNYSKIYQKKKIYLLIYPYGEYSSLAEGILDKIDDKLIHHNCPTTFGSSGSPIILKSNYKVIGVHRRKVIEPNENKFLHNEGTFIKFPIEEFINEYIINKDIQNKYNSFNNINNNNYMNNLNNNIFYFCCNIYI